MLFDLSCKLPNQNKACSYVVQTNNSYNAKKKLRTYLTRLYPEYKNTIKEMNINNSHYSIHDVITVLSSL